MSDTKSDDGWVMVKSKKGGRAKPAPSPLSVATFEPGFKPTEPTGSRTYLAKETIAGKYFYTRTRIENSRESRILEAIVAEFVHDNFNINGEVVLKAVCLGLGTFDPADGNASVKEKAHVQLACFLIMVEELERQMTQHITCIFQDPAFAPSDIEFLTSLGHDVVDSPVAFEFIDAQTLLFGCHLYREVYAMAFKGELPAMFVGTGWDVWSDIVDCWRPEDCNLDAIATMEKTHKKYPFPEAKGSDIFWGTSIYFC